MKIASLTQKYKYLGRVYQLIEQFELISRTDLAKLSGYAPASITGLSKKLIAHHLVLERTAQNLPNRGRPAVGLSLSPFHWQFLCMTLSATELSIYLCNLSGESIHQAHYPLTLKTDNLAKTVTSSLINFIENYPVNEENLLAMSVSVMGKLDQEKRITQLGNLTLSCELVPELAKIIHKPIYCNEHFQLWLLAESVLGSLISHDDVIFLQLDEAINLSVLLRGELLQRDEHKRMNIDKMMMPKFSELSELIADDVAEMSRYQLANQITFPALARIIDKLLPNNIESLNQKISWFSEQIQHENPNALLILEHITDNLSYMLLNLINLFSIEKLMFCSPLLSSNALKTRLFNKMREKIAVHLKQESLNIDLVTSQYQWNSPLIPAVAIKYELYAGNLIQNIIKL